ncbi:MAG: glutathione S-transferase N-terminal domain-containing protein [Nitratireductor sp.]|nr:glutathione S-transferase N-terminal domain-containing protein [Nitratireductor sp.]MCC0022302.1 glutathione S-transferase N-terminal domain-containing protein [Nitratireductor sp.]
MDTLQDYLITRKWPPKNPQAIQLYSLPTPNGVKVSAMLEESGLPYDAHTVNFATNDQKSPEFLSLNPNNKIPAIIDPEGPGGKPMPLFESGAILIYLAEKSGKLLSADPVERMQTLQWLMFQMGGIGPMFGQFGFFHKFAGKEIEDKTAFNRYRDESIRLLGVLDKGLEGKDYLVGNSYSIADISIWPWVRTLVDFYEAEDIVGFDDFSNVDAWFDRCFERPASMRAINIPPRA